MCGRFTQTQSTSAIAAAFQLNHVPPLTPRYNIAPTQPVATLVQAANGKIPNSPSSKEQNPDVPTTELSGRQFKFLHWGLIPSWAKDPAIGARMINARAETVAEKPAFRAAFKRQRCLIMADGFYEWQGTGKGKQPFYFHLPDRQLFAFAGLWEVWQNQDEAIASCTIITTAANAVVQPIHDRMPVILDAQDYDQWLDPDFQHWESLQSLLQPYPKESIMAYPVSTVVNRPTNDTAECLQIVNSQ